MQCPICHDANNNPTGNLELVSALSITITTDGSLARPSAILLDEYLSCNNCTDPECSAEDCVGWHWEQAGNERRIALEPNSANPYSSLMPAKG